MSVLLGIYIDMELKTFMHSKDSSSIATKLVSALWIYLGKLETIGIKIEIMSLRSERPTD